MSFLSKVLLNGKVMWKRKLATGAWRGPLFCQDMRRYQRGEGGEGGVKVETEGEFSLWVSVTAWAAITCLHPTVVISLAIMATHDVSQSHSQMCVGGIWNKFDKSDFVFVVCFEKFSVSYLVGF